MVAIFAIFPTLPLVEMKMIGGTYEGTLNENRSEVTGKWSQVGESWPLVLKRAEKAADSDFV